MTTIQKLFQNHTIRFIEKDGEMLVCAPDVMAALGYPKSSMSQAWYSMKAANSELFGTIKTDFTVASNGKSYETSFLNSKQLIVLLMKSHKDAAIPFQIWATDVLDKELKKQAQYVEAPTHRTEEAIQNQLNFLAGFFENKLVFERAELDPFAGNRVDGKPKIRRYDITEKLPKLFRIYELKKGVITESEISSTLNSKAYAEIAATHYPNRVIDIIFVGTSLDESGQRYLERNGAEDSYREFNVSGVTYRAKVRFISISDLAEKWIQKVYDSRPISDRWFITQNVLPKLSFLIDDQVKVLYEAKYPTYQMLSEGKASKVVPFSKPVKKKAA